MRILLLNIALHNMPLSSGCEEVQFGNEVQILLPINNDLSASTSELPQVELEESFTVRLGAQIDSEEPSSSSDSDNDIECMTADDSKSIWKKWLQEQPKDNLKMLSVMLTDTFTERFGLTKTNAAKESVHCYKTSL